MSRTIAESEKLYEQIKNFFLKNEKSQFVIEISDRPMAEWNIIYVNSVEEMIAERGRLIENGYATTGLINFEGHYNFYFVDHNFAKSQNMNNGKIIAFHDYTIQTFDLTKVVDELRQLQGS